MTEETQVLIDALKELNLKVEALRARVEQLENPPVEDDIQEWIKVNKWS